MGLTPKEKRIACCSIILGIVLCCLMLLIHAFISSELKTRVDNIVWIRTPEQSAEVYNRWVDERNEDSDQTTFNVYMFNYTNLDDVFNAGAQPIAEMVGPYVYREYTKKIDVQFSTNKDTVFYRKFTQYEFQSQLSSNLNENDKITGVWSFYLRYLQDISIYRTGLLPTSIHSALTSIIQTFASPVATGATHQVLTTTFNDMIEFYKAPLASGGTNYMINNHVTNLQTTTGSLDLALTQWGSGNIVTSSRLDFSNFTLRTEALSPRVTFNLSKTQELLFGDYGLVKINTNNVMSAQLSSSINMPFAYLFCRLYEGTSANQQYARNLWGINNNEFTELYNYLNFVFTPKCTTNDECLEYITFLWAKSSAKQSPTLPTYTQVKNLPFEFEFSTFASSAHMFTPVQARNILNGTYGLLYRDIFNATGSMIGQDTMNVPFSALFAKLSSSSPATLQSMYSINNTQMNSLLTYLDQILPSPCSPLNTSQCMTAAMTQWGSLSALRSYSARDAAPASQLNLYPEYAGWLKYVRGDTSLFLSAAESARVLYGPYGLLQYNTNNLNIWPVSEGFLDINSKSFAYILAKSIMGQSQSTRDLFASLWQISTNKLNAILDYLTYLQPLAIVNTNTLENKILTQENISRSRLPFVTKSVRDWLWNKIDPLSQALNVSSLSSLFVNHTSISGMNDMFSAQQYGITEEMYTGQDNVFNALKLIKINNSSFIPNTLPAIGRGGWCYQNVAISGTNGRQFSPATFNALSIESNIDPLSTLTFWSQPLLRPVQLKHTSTVNYMKIDAYRFRLEDNTYEPNNLYSQNYAGIGNLTCPKGNPILVTQPLFLNINQSALPFQFPTGSLLANEPEHQTYVDVDQLTGTVIRSYQRYQYVLPYRLPSQQSTSLLPVAWIEQKYTINNKRSEYIHYIYITTKGLETAWFIILSFSCAFFFLGTLFLLCAKNDDQSQNSQSHFSLLVKSSSNVAADDIAAANPQQPPQLAPSYSSRSINLMLEQKSHHEPTLELTALSPAVEIPSDSVKDREKMMRRSSAPASSSSAQLLDLQSLRKENQQQKQQQQQHDDDDDNSEANII